MSKDKRVTNTTENGRPMTRYDRKLQERKEKLAKEKKEKNINTIIGIVAVVALAALVLSFPIRSYKAVNGEVFKVGGEKVTQLEYIYNFVDARQAFLEQNSYYFSMMGITDLSSIDSMQYSETMTFGDYFEQTAVENIVTSRGLKAAAKAEGFEYDCSEGVATLKEALTELASENDMTLKGYLQAMYGSLANWSRIEKFIEEYVYVSAYYQEVYDRSTPTDDEIQAAYEEDKKSYDSVDYRMTVVSAELPTTAPDGTVQTDADGNEIAYEPTEEEIKTAMAAAKKKADEAVKTVAKDGTPFVDDMYLYINTEVADFLYADGRKAGDTIVVEDTENNRYLVAAFEKRYRNEANTVDVRVITTTEVDSETILNEWQKGEATEESFMELIEKYDEYGVSEIGGLFTGIPKSALGTEAETWLKEERKAGDVKAVSFEDGVNYTIYYVGENEPEWKLNAENTIVTEKMSKFVEEASAFITIDDPNGYLTYLKVIAESSEESFE